MAKQSCEKGKGARVWGHYSQQIAFYLWMPISSNRVIATTLCISLGVFSYMHNYYHLLTPSISPFGILCLNMHTNSLTSHREGEREREGRLSGKIPRFVLDYWR